MWSAYVVTCLQVRPVAYATAHNKVCMAFYKPQMEVTRTIRRPEIDAEPTTEGKKRKRREIEKKERFIGTSVTLLGPAIGRQLTVCYIAPRPLSILLNKQVLSFEPFERKLPRIRFTGTHVGLLGKFRKISESFASSRVASASASSSRPIIIFNACSALAKSL